MTGPSTEAWAVLAVIGGTIAGLLSGVLVCEMALEVVERFKAWRWRRRYYHASGKLRDATEEGKSEL